MCTTSMYSVYVVHAQKRDQMLKGRALVQNWAQFIAMPFIHHAYNLVNLLT